MPSKTKKQAKMMKAACHDPKTRKKVGISRKVACDFWRADREAKILHGKKKKK